jgi:hypothetical protein
MNFQLISFMSSVFTSQSSNSKKELLAVCEYVDHCFAEDLDDEEW